MAPGSSTAHVLPAPPFSFILHPSAFILPSPPRCNRRRFAIISFHGSVSAHSCVVLAREKEAGDCWSRVVAGPTVVVRRALPGPAEPRPDVIVTDLAEIGSRGAGDPAVVRIGVDGPADVRLPADCSERELNLACRLLTQIVRLRRRERLAAQIHQELSAQAMTDPLTGLANRRAWEAALKERVAMAATAENQLCLAILDLDHFKRINDDHGHAIGDEVLRATGQAVYDNLRQDDFVARLGGDEFGLLLWAPDEELAAAVVERVRTALPARFARTILPAPCALPGIGLRAPPPALPRDPLRGRRRFAA